MLQWSSIHCTSHLIIDKPIFILKMGITFAFQGSLNSDLSIFDAVPIVIIILNVNYAIVVVIKVIHMVPRQRALLSRCCHVVVTHLSPSPSESLLMSVQASARAVARARSRRITSQGVRDILRTEISCSDDGIMTC